MSQDVVNVNEYESLAKDKLPKMVFDFYSSGAEDQFSLRDNKLAFSRIRLRPRVLVDVSHIDVTANVLGFNIAMPIMVAPTALHKLAHPAGELATARAASAANTIMVLSSHSSCNMEEVTATGPGVRFFQLYVYKSKHITQVLVRRAEQAGYKAIVLTVDTPRLGRREQDIKNRFKLPPQVFYKNMEGLIDLEKMEKTSDSSLASWADSHYDRSLSWKDQLENKMQLIGLGIDYSCLSSDGLVVLLNNVEECVQDVKWLQSITKLPVLLKGILTPQDAILAVQAGVSGIIVSNHGARQLDHVPATISALEEVVEAVGGRVPVFLDGGIRRGTDVFKALALGASGVFIGRPVVFSLAVDGEAGVKKALEMLRVEFELTMALMGVCSVKQISRRHVQTENELHKPNIISKL